MGTRGYWESSSASVDSATPPVLICGSDSANLRGGLEQGLERARVSLLRPTFFGLRGLATSKRQLARHFSTWPFPRLFYFPAFRTALGLCFYIFLGLLMCLEKNGRVFLEDLWFQRKPTGKPPCMGSHKKDAHMT